MKLLLQVMVCSLGMTGISQTLFADDVSVVVGLTEHDPGQAQPGQLNAPFAVDFDSAGGMIIAEYDGGRLLRWSNDGGLEVLAGDGTAGYQNGAAKTARFNKLHNVVLGADGRMYLSDHLNHAVRVYDPETQTVRSFAGDGSEGFAGDGGPADGARFRQPICVAFSPTGDRLLIADIGNHRVRQIDMMTKVIQTIAGNGKKARPRDGEIPTMEPLTDPRAVAEAPDGRIYILERGGNALRMIQNNQITTVAGSGKPGNVDGAALEASFNGPKHLDIASDGRVFIADDNNHRVRIYDPKTGQVGTVSTAPFTLRRPHGVKVHGDQLYIADSYHHRILKLPLPQ